MRKANFFQKAVIAITIALGACKFLGLAELSWWVVVSPLLAYSLLIIFSAVIILSVIWRAKPEDRRGLADEIKDRIAN